MPAAAGQSENEPNDADGVPVERDPSSQDDRADHFGCPQALVGQGDGEREGEDQAGRQQRLVERQVEVADGPRRQQLPGDHHGQAQQPAGPVQQVDDQAQPQKVAVWRLLRGVLLQYPADPQQHRCHQGEGYRNKIHVAPLLVPPLVPRQGLACCLCFAPVVTG
jgi:hypothetical protein